MPPTSGRAFMMSRWKRHSVDGLSGPVHDPYSPSMGIAAIMSGVSASYGVADGEISMVSPCRAELFPATEVRCRPWSAPDSSAKMVEGFAVQISPHFVGRCPGRDPDGLDRGPRDVRGQGDIGQLEQRPIRWNGLDRKGLDGRAAQMVRDQRVVQGLVVHQWASRRVDKETSGFHGGELRGADHPPGFFGNTRVKTNDIRSRQQAVEADLLDAIIQIFDRP